MKQKMKLENLKVQSFATSLMSNEKRTIEGRSYEMDSADLTGHYCLQGCGPSHINCPKLGVPRIV